jgi:predicted protein tyrosine phosphatase
MDQPLDDLKLRVEAVVKQLASGDTNAHTVAANLANDLKATMAELPEAKAALGSLIGRLESARKSGPKADQLQWVLVGSGHLAIGHRPKLKALVDLRHQGATHIVTLLSDSEGAPEIGAAARKAALEWLWFPLDSAEPPGAERQAEVRRFYEEVQAVLGAGGKVYVHCSAGIHRTGMIAYGLLRHLRQAPAQAQETLRLLRSHTQENVGEQRLAWGEQFAAADPDS